MNRLGQCEQCRAQLCTKGDMICCSVCGLPVPNHPLAVKPEPVADKPKKQLAGGLKR